MQPPGLANRTGRFASSVKVTEIQQTPKGFPSIGYTYRKNPYQVFEEGSGNITIVAMDTVTAMAMAMATVMVMAMVMRMNRSGL